MTRFNEITSNSYSIRTVSIRLLHLFVTLLIANGITAIPEVSDIAKYAKLAVLFLSILLISRLSKAILFIKENKLIILFWMLCLFFSLHKLISKGLEIEILITNITFIFYIYFFYLLIDRITMGFTDTSDKVLVFICIPIGKILNINLIIWTSIGLALNIPIWHQLENRVGLGLFYNNYIQLGIFGLCGSLVHLLLFKYGKKSRTTIFWFFIYVTIVVLSNSRNAQLILFTSIFLLFFPTIRYWIIRFKWYILSILFFGIWYMVDIYNFLLDQTIQNITTGRSSIWSYVLHYYKHSSIFSGHGIFGLNNEILLNNKTDNYYFNRIDFLYFHNSFLEIFTASGVIGFLLFLWYLILGIHKSKRSLLNPILIGILTGAFFESFLVQPVILITFFFWILFFLNRKFKKTEGTTQTPFRSSIKK